MTLAAPHYLYRFVYFNVRGAGELCRLSLVASGADWEDVRYPMALASTGFSYGPEFRRDAKAGAFDVNMGSLPILQVVSSSSEEKEQNNDATPPRLIANLGQSHSIAKFVAAQHGMAGRNALEQAKIDALYESCRDIKTHWYRTKRNKGGKEAWFSSGGSQSNETVDDETDTITPTTLHQYCLRLEKAISASSPFSRNETMIGSPWCMGGPDPSLADIAFYDLLGTPATSVVTGSVPSFFDGESDRIRQAFPPEQCPRLFESVSAFGELKLIQEWEKKRPETFT